MHGKTITRAVLWVLLAGCASGLLLGCRQNEPEPPSQNLFYQVHTVNIESDGAQPQPTAVSGENFLVNVSNDVLIDPEFEATWTINWNCMSDRCEFEQCVGEARSSVRDVVDERWLEVDRRIDWNQGCGRQSNWLTQVDRHSGRERYPSEDTLFLFWAGSRASRIDQQITLGDGRSVNVWCTGPQKAEVAEEEGWRSLYDGEVCYDAQTGMLVFMSYIKRWVFSGQYEGKEYERAFFGDSESYEQLLETTNAQLSFIENE